MNPLYYGAWLDHLVKRGNIVVYPRYQATLLTGISEFTPNTMHAVKDAVSRLKNEPGHVAADFTSLRRWVIRWGACSRRMLPRWRVNRDCHGCRP